MGPGSSSYVGSNLTLPLPLTLTLALTLTLTLTLPLIGPACVYTCPPGVQVASRARVGNTTSVPRPDLNPNAEHEPRPYSI